jgi:hypothetical protein
MVDRVLYFPLIRVPQSRWFTQVLLYWDEVGSIVPYEYVHKPDELGQYMQELVAEGLMTQIFPGPLLHETPAYSEEFVRYLRLIAPRLHRRQERFATGDRRRIHLEKLHGVETELVRLKLAVEDQTSSYWYDVERDTAADFMTYLATTLGAHPQVAAAPVTDHLDHLRRLAPGPYARTDTGWVMRSSRLAILDHLLPIPAEPVSPIEISRFKHRHGQHLRGFRRAIESELTVLASIPDPTLRLERLEFFVTGCKEEVREIEGNMRGAWKNVVFGRMLAVLGVVSPVAALANAVYSALASNGTNSGRPMAYAALTQHHFARTR